MRARGREDLDTCVARPAEDVEDDDLEIRRYDERIDRRIRLRRRACRRLRTRETRDRLVGGGEEFIGAAAGRLDMPERRPHRLIARIEEQHIQRDAFAREMRRRERTHVVADVEGVGAVDEHDAVGKQDDRAAPRRIGR